MHLSALVLMLVVAAGSGYVRDVQAWRADYEAKLKAADGWLSVSGLIWLHDGATAVPGGVVHLLAGKAVFEADGGAKTDLKSDNPGPPTAVHAGSITLTLIDRGGKLGIRVRDPNAPTRSHFTGSKWFPIRPAMDVKARWIAYPAPKQIAILNVLGMTEPQPSPGFAEFTLSGKTLRLEPITEDDHLFFILRDLTAGKTTYGAGRFLYAATPRNGIVELDFNKAENPPCAFTAFATCPLPPKQNILPVAIEAGEKKYGSH